MNIPFWCVAVLSGVLLLWCLRHPQNDPLWLEKTCNRALLSGVLMTFPSGIRGVQPYPLIRRGGWIGHFPNELILLALIATVTLTTAIFVTWKRRDFDNAGIIATYFAFALIGTSPGVLITLNGCLDRSNILRRETEIVARQYRRGGGKAGRSWRLLLRDWRTGGRAHINVDSDVFKAHPVGDNVTIETGNGALGLEWIYRVH